MRCWGGNERADVKVKGGHPGTIVAYLEAIRITRVSVFGWAGFCEYLAGPILTLLGFEPLLLSANLWCAFLFFSFLRDLYLSFSEFFVLTMPFLIPF